MAGAVEVATRQWPTNLWLHVRPPRIAQGLALLALMGHVAVWGFEAPFGRSTLGGAALLAAGLGWMLWAAWMFRQAATTIRPTAVPSILVDEGPYRYGRNPMYLGMTVALLGVGLALGAPFMAVAAVAFAVIVHRVHIPFEEAQLRRAFGGWYSDYAATVRRWL
jgi:protein-S-isoprenylcysteine O-methyltransferase Ste14